MAYKISTDCIACGTCIDECPMGAISEGEHYSIDPDVCTARALTESSSPKTWQISSIIKLEIRSH